MLQRMVRDDHVSENTKYSPTHFFGVYDGHGGIQVCLKILPFNYTISCIIEVTFHSIPFHIEGMMFS